MTQKSKPERRCVGCMTSKDKSSLIRVVRTPDGTFAIDRTGKMNGRGAYLCDDVNCLKRAVKGHGLERSFHASIDKAVYEALQREFETS